MNDDKGIILPDGSEASSTLQTERSLERRKEDKDYIPVIIKRNDEVVRHPDDTLEHAIEEGLGQLERPFISLALSSIAAGLILGFAAMLVAFAAQLVPADSGPYLKRLVSALFYPLGFIVCILSGTQLFTEHTAIAVYPILDRKSSLKKLLRLWGTVISGNFMGTFICAILLVAVEDVTQIGDGYLAVAEHILHPGSGAIFISALMAGWLMAQGSWLVISSPTGPSQIICIFIVTFIIGIGGLHHSIAGSAELFTAMLSFEEITPSMVSNCLAFAVLGNIVGGSIFVAVLNYAQIKEYWRD